MKARCADGAITGIHSGRPRISPSRAPRQRERARATTSRRSRSCAAPRLVNRPTSGSLVPPATITVSRLERDSYALSWRIGDRIHYGKMWTAKNDEGCFVRATFDYDVRERVAFDAIIAKVTAAGPACPR